MFGGEQRAKRWCTTADRLKHALCMTLFFTVDWGWCGECCFAEFAALCSARARSTFEQGLQVLQLLYTAASSPVLIRWMLKRM